MSIQAIVILALSQTAQAAEFPSDGPYAQAHAKLSEAAGTHSGIRTRVSDGCGPGTAYNATRQLALEIDLPLKNVEGHLKASRGLLLDIDPNEFPGPNWHPADHEGLVTAVGSARKAAEQARGFGSFIAKTTPDDPEAAKKAQKDFCGALRRLNELAYPNGL